MASNLVIIGNGVAGMEAAIAARKVDSSARITIVSEESEHFFARTALMYVASAQLDQKSIEPKPRDFYQQHRFERIFDRVEKLDVAKQTLSLVSGSSLTFDRLLIATGSRARSAPWTGAEGIGVGHFVTLQDLAWLETELWGSSKIPRPKREDVSSPYRRSRSVRDKKSVPPTQPAVIGGGLIGIEAVEVFLARGLRPRFFIREPRFWPNVLSPDESSWIEERLTEHGCQLHLGANVDELKLDADECVAAIRVGESEFSCDMALVAIGVVPNSAWLAESSIKRDANGAILVDRHLQTNVFGVYAAGDCAAISFGDGEAKNETLWYTSRDQGRLAGANLAGKKEQYTRAPYYNSAKLMDIEYTVVGDIDGREYDDFFFAENDGVRSTIRIRIEEGSVKGFSLLGRRWDHLILQKMIGRELGWVRENLHRASFDTEFVPPIDLRKEAG